MARITDVGGFTPANLQYVETLDVPEMDFTDMDALVEEFETERSKSMQEIEDNFFKAGELEDSLTGIKGDNVYQIEKIKQAREREGLTDDSFNLSDADLANPYVLNNIERKTNRFLENPEITMILEEQEKFKEFQKGVARVKAVDPNLARIAMRDAQAYRDRTDEDGVSAHQLDVKDYEPMDVQQTVMDRVNALPKEVYNVISGFDDGDGVYSKSQLEERRIQNINQIIGDMLKDPALRNNLRASGYENEQQMRDYLEQQITQAAGRQTTSVTTARDTQDPEYQHEQNKENIGRNAELSDLEQRALDERYGLGVYEKQPDGTIVKRKPTMGDVGYASNNTSSSSTTNTSYEFNYRFGNSTQSERDANIIDEEIYRQGYDPTAVSKLEISQAAKSGNAKIRDGKLVYTDDNDEIQEIELGERKTFAKPNSNYSNTLDSETDVNYGVIQKFETGAGSLVNPADGPVGGKQKPSLGQFQFNGTMMDDFLNSSLGQVVDRKTAAKIVNLRKAMQDAIDSGDKTELNRLAKEANDILQYETANNPDFVRNQFKYVYEKRYKPAIDYATKKFGKALPQGLKTYIADTANQHGGYEIIMDDAYDILSNRFENAGDAPYDQILDAVDVARRRYAKKYLTAESFANHTSSVGRYTELYDYAKNTLGENASDISLNYDGSMQVGDYKGFTPDKPTKEQIEQSKKWTGDNTTTPTQGNLSSEQEEDLPFNERLRRRQVEDGVIAEGEELKVQGGYPLITAGLAGSSKLFYGGMKSYLKSVPNLSKVAADYAVKVAAKYADKAVSKTGDEGLGSALPSNAKTPLEDEIPNFVARILTGDLVRENPDGSVSTHLMASAEVDGKHIVFPTLVESNGELIEVQDPISHAINNNNYLIFDTEKEAREYAEGGYKNK